MIPYSLVGWYQLFGQHYCLRQHWSSTDISCGTALPTVTTAHAIITQRTTKSSTNDCSNYVDSEGGGINLLRSFCDYIPIARRHRPLDLCLQHRWGFSLLYWILRMDKRHEDFWRDDLNLTPSVVFCCAGFKCYGSVSVNMCCLISFVGSLLLKYALCMQWPCRCNLIVLDRLRVCSIVDLRTVLNCV